LTLDLELQDAAEMAVRASDEDYRSLHETDFHADLQEAAIAIIDAHTGDVLAVAGAPITGDTTRRVPGFGWKSNGSIGSVVKPIVLLEHLESQRWGRACQAPDQIHACGGYLDYPGVRLMCDGTHHEQGRSPVYALAVRACP
jgi:membrane peptidoglycan carboxypeptidase